MFIVFEGVDGAGKSTQVECVATALRARHRAVTTLREPGDSPFGRQLRDEWRHARLAPEREFEMLVRDRRIDVAERILPALAAGQIVLLDRYFYSHVYQAALGMDLAAMLAENLAFAPVPDRALILRLAPERSRARMAGRAAPSVLDRDAELLVRVAALYDSFGDRPEVRFIDADRDAPTVTADLVRAIDALVEEQR